jgi:hypothetical protein
MQCGRDRVKKTSTPILFVVLAYFFLFLPAHMCRALVEMNARDIAAAEETIKNYVHKKHGWPPDEYQVSLHSKEPFSDTVTFTVWHRIDRDPATLGAEKSFYLIFDMRTMTVLRELHWQ